MTLQRWSNRRKMRDIRRNGDGHPVRDLIRSSCYHPPFIKWRKCMDGHRKLLILALNELLDRELVSLDGDNEGSGHLVTEIAGENAVILWQDIGFQELRLSIWWKYAHSCHPQANLTGNAREEFVTSRPL